jgi:endonuclease/exonuclease/phosphatase family metal-dependent hydrolase
VIVETSHYAPINFGVRSASLGWHGNALLVRKGVEILDRRRIELPAFEPRGAVLADLRVDGRTVRVVGMHLGLIGRWRQMQAKAVTDYLEKLEGRMPTIIMGDLNQWNTEGGCLAHFAAQHQVIAPGPSYHSRRPMLPLDRIITSPDFHVEEAGVHHSPLARYGSDHLPVWARLELEPAASAAAA